MLSWLLKPLLFCFYLSVGLFLYHVLFSSLWNGQVKLFVHPRSVLEKLNNAVNSTLRPRDTQHNGSLWHCLTLECGFNGHLYVYFIGSWSSYCQISQMKAGEESISYLFFFHLLLSAIVKHPQYTMTACLLIPLMSHKLLYRARSGLKARIQERLASTRWAKST